MVLLNKLRQVHEYIWRRQVIRKLSWLTDHTQVFWEHQQGRWYLVKYDQGTKYLIYYNTDNNYILGDGQALDKPQPDQLWERLRTICPKVYVDVGANNGWYYSLRFAKQCQRVYAFEPDPQMIHLAINAQINGVFDKFSIIPEVVTDHTGATGFTTGKGASNHIDPHGRKVRCTTLDGFFAENYHQKIDLIKIDVEGYEEQVIQGAQRILRQDHPVVVYKDLPHLRQANPQFPLGYVFERIGNNVLACYRD